jgi:phosphatidylglycerol:prolipoprotein diacylglycerol transferase
MQFQSPGPIAFTIGGFEIMWYGILITAGIVIGAVIINKRAPRYHGLSADRTLNFSIFILIAAIIGLRLYYVAFNWSYYAEDLGRIFQLREGGLAIHGGLIGAILMALLLCKIYHEKFFNICDLYITAVPLGQAIGRWGNFFNSEAHGGPTDLPWGVIVDGVKVHPTFLYESIWCLLLFFFLLHIDNRRKFVGQTFLLYAILYSLERFFVEWLRTDSLMLFGVLKQAQVLSLVVIIVCLIVYIKKSRKAGRRR